jgi:Flp pilus assembly protein TadG
VRQALRGQRGTSTVEFLAILPFFLIVMLLIMEGSRAWMTLNLAETAAREAARTGAIGPDDATVRAEGNARLLEVLAAGGLSCSGQCDVLCQPGTCVPLDGNRYMVEATVTVTFRTVVPLFIPPLSAITLQRKATHLWELSEGA